MLPERYEVEIRPTGTGGDCLVILTDMESGRKLTGSTMLSTSSMVGVLIEDHRERRDAEPADLVLEGAKQRRREEISQAALSVFDSEEEARAWLMSPNGKLSGRRPLAVAGGSDDGLMLVQDLLTRVRLAEDRSSPKP